MCKVWITRTNPAAQESAEVWRDAGFEPLVAPLLGIESVRHEAISKDAVLIFTSKNAIDHVTCNGQRAICVGDATADKARGAGFSDVISVDGTSADVTQWVLAHLPNSQPICHVSGWHVRGAIAEDLQRAGYSADRVKVYRSTPQIIWPDEPVALAALYSPLAAATFAQAATARDVSALSVVCISPAAANALSDLKLKSVSIAAHPREDELIMAAKSA